MSSPSSNDSAPSESHRIVTLERVSRVFLTDEVETHALCELSLGIDAGEMVVVTGPSGCGKSTLLNILGLLDSPSSGSYLLDGRPVEPMPRRERSRLRSREIGFVFQSFNLIADLSVLENVELPLSYRRIPIRRRRELAVAALERVELAHRLNHRPSQLSGGQQQRAAVARAIAGYPRLLLADEPTGNLDSANGNRVMDLLSELNEEGMTLIMVTHSDQYSSFARRRIELLDGKLIDDAPMRLVCSGPTTPSDH